MPLSLENVGHRFGQGPWLFRALTQTVNEGDVVALVGPSGSGKSTLLSLIAHWVTPAEGAITLTSSHRAGLPHVRQEPKIAWVFQNPHGVPGRKVIDHVALPFLAAGLSPKEADDRAYALLADFHLENVAARPFATLSGGEVQRMLLARALASEPDLLLVDEPTAQLDQRTASHVADTLTALQGRGLAVVIATHDPHVRDRCTRIIDLASYAPSGDEDSAA